MQEIILGIIILVCIVWVIRRTVLCFNRINHEDTPCEGCPCGCRDRAGKCENEKK
jgi:hypothetical protein